MRCCSVCGAVLPDNAMFCGECGGPAVEMQPQAQPEYQYAQAQPEYQYAQPQPEYPYAQAGYDYAPVVEAQPKKKKKLGLLLVIIAAVVVVAAAVVIGYFTNWFGLGAPLNGLTKAMDKTFGAESMTVKVTTKITYDGEEINSEGEYRIVLDADKEKIYYILESDGHTMLFDDGTTYVYMEADGENDYDYAYIIEAEESAGEKFFEIYDGKGIDWEALVEENELEEYIKANKMADFVEEFNKEYLRDSKWLEKYLDFEKDGNTYTFTPNMKRLSKELTDIVEDSRAFTDKGKEWFAEEMADAEGKLRVSVTVSGGYVSKLTFKYEGDDGEKIEYVVSISGVNKSSISNKDMNAIREKVETAIEENTCSECGEELWWLVEGEYHGDCAYCDKHDDFSYTYNDQPCCYSCYWERSNGYGDCENCGDYGKLYGYKGYSLCYDCNYEATHTCENCGEPDAYYSYSSYNALCSECYYALKYGYDYCDLCGEFDDLYDYDGYDMCWDCYYDAKYGY